MRISINAVLSASKVSASKVLTVAAAALLAGGCAELYEATFGTPVERAAVNASASDLTLCRNLRNHPNFPLEVRQEWAQELARRGQNCTPFIGILSAEDAPARGHPAGQAYFRAEQVSGPNRICRYDRLGHAVVITISASSFCPPTLP